MATRARLRTMSQFKRVGMLPACLFDRRSREQTAEGRARFESSEDLEICRSVRRHLHYLSKIQHDRVGDRVASSVLHLACIKSCSLNRRWRALFPLYTSLCASAALFILSLGRHILIWKADERLHLGERLQANEQRQGGVRLQAGGKLEADRERLELE